jgi:hypothetical protein
MVLVIKLSSFGWSVYDASLKPELLSKEQESHAVRSFPSFMQFYAYAFDFSTFLVGPGIEFRDFQKFIMNEPPFDTAPSPLIPGLKAFGAAVASMIIYVLYGGTLSFSYMATEEFRTKYSPIAKYYPHTLTQGSSSFMLPPQSPDASITPHGNLLKALLVSPAYLMSATMNQRRNTTGHADKTCPLVT